MADTCHEAVMLRGVHEVRHRPDSLGESHESLNQRCFSSGRRNYAEDGLLKKGSDRVSATGRKTSGHGMTADKGRADGQELPRPAEDLGFGASRVGDEHAGR